MVRVRLAVEVQSLLCTRLGLPGATAYWSLTEVLQAKLGTGPVVQS